MLAACEACASLAAMRRSLALAAVLLLTWPALARAQSSPFTPLPQAPQQTATAPATTPTTTTGSGGGDSGLSGSAETALLVSGGVLIALIALAILRDARRAAPRRRRAAPAPSGPAPTPTPGAKGRPTGKASAARRRRRRR